MIFFGMRFMAGRSAADYTTWIRASLPPNSSSKRSPDERSDIRGQARNTRSRMSLRSCGLHVDCQRQSRGAMSNMLTVFAADVADLMVRVRGRSNVKVRR